MGSKLTKVTEGVESTREEIDEAIEKAEDDASEIEDLREALSDVPDDADDEIAALRETVESSGVSEAVSDMEGDVRSTLDGGRSIGESTIREAEEGADNSREAGDAYGHAADTRFGGEGSDAQSRAEGNAEAFDDAGIEAQDVIDEGDDEFERFMREIQG